MIIKIMHGRCYKFTGNSAGNSNWTQGMLVYCKFTDPASYPDGYVMGGNCITVWSQPNGGGMAYSAYARDLEEAWSSRKEHAEFEEREVDILKKKIAEKEHLIKRLKEFDSDEEEIAAMMVRAMKESELSEKDAIKNLAKTLKGRLRTDLL